MPSFQPEPSQKIPTITWGAAFLVACLTWAENVWPQESQLQGEDRPRLSTLIEQLGSSSYARRRQAFNDLWELGPEVSGHLDDAIRSNDKQVAESARRLRLLNKIRQHCDDLQKAVELAEFFERASEENLIELAAGGHWEVAELFLDEHPAIEVRFQEKFFQESSARYLLQMLITYSMDQGDVELAWPLVSRLLPSDLAAWTASQTGLPLSDKGSDVYDRAVRLFMVGRTEEALQLDLPVPLKMRLILRGFRWERLADPAMVNALLGSQPSTSRQAAQAVLAEFSGDSESSVRFWIDSLGLQEQQHDIAEPSSFEELEVQATIDALRKANDTTENSSSYDQWLLALILSGRVVAIERFLEEQSSQLAYDFYAANSNYEEAFKQVGLQADLGNFDSWLGEMTDKARTEIEQIQNQEVTDSTILESGILLGKIGSTLVGLGYREQSMQILERLIALGQRGLRPQSPFLRGASRGREYLIWDLCILRWLSREEWRACCLDAIEEHFDLLPKAYRGKIFARLFDKLGDCAWTLWTESPATLTDQSAAERIRQTREQLDALERCDRAYFGANAQPEIKDWLYRAALKTEGDREEDDFSGDSTKLSLARIAHLMGYSDLALEWVQWELADFATSSKANGLAARISLDLHDAETALKFFEAAHRHSFEDGQNLPDRLKTRLILGQFEKARQEQLAYWMAATHAHAGGNPLSSYRWIEELALQHQWDEAALLAERNFRLSRNVNYLGFWEARQYSRILEERERYQESADVMRSVFVELLRPFSQPLRLIVEREELPVLRYSAARERMARAAAAIEQGDYHSAREHLDVTFRLQSQDIEPVVVCYPRLIEAGQTELAEDLFDRSRNGLQSHLKQWPNDATTLNNLAWMYSQCSRELEEALSHSQKAVELSPHSAVYLDTLAEVHFRRGERSKAIELMRGCVRIDPREPHYRENLVRFSMTDK